MRKSQHLDWRCSLKKKTHTFDCFVEYIATTIVMSFESKRYTQIFSGRPSIGKLEENRMWEMIFIDANLKFGFGIVWRRKRWRDIHVTSQSDKFIIPSVNGIHSPAILSNISHGLVAWTLQMLRCRTTVYSVTWDPNFGFL